MADNALDKLAGIEGDDALDRMAGIPSDYRSAGKQAAAVGMTGHSPQSKKKSYYDRIINPLEPNERPSSVKQFLTETLPASATKTAVAAVTSPFWLSKAIAEKGITGTVGDIASDMGDRLGLSGLDTAKEKAISDPVGTAAAVAGVTPAARVASVVGKAGLRGAGRAAEVVARPVAGKIVRAIGDKPEVMMDQTLKQPTTLAPATRAKNVQTALEGGYMPNKKGVTKLHDDISAINDHISEIIQQGKRDGQGVEVSRIVNGLERLKNKAKQSDEYAANLAGIEDQITKIQNHPTIKDGKIPVDVAQAMKVDIYKQLSTPSGGSAYQQPISSFGKAIKKTTAYELKEGIAELFPEVTELNPKEGALLELRKVLTRASNRIGNREGVGIAPAIKIGAGAATGKLGTIAGGIVGLIEHPSIQPRLARVLYIARKKAGQAASLPSIQSELAGFAQRFMDSLDLDTRKLATVTGRIGKSVEESTTLPVHSETMRVTPEGQAVPPGAKGGPTGTGMAPEEIAAARQNLSRPGPMTKRGVPHGEPYNPDVVIPDEIIPPKRSAERPATAPVRDAERPVAGYIEAPAAPKPPNFTMRGEQKALPEPRKRLPERGTAIAGSKGGVIMPEDINRLANPRGMSEKEISASQEKIGPRAPVAPKPKNSAKGKRKK